MSNQFPKLKKDILMIQPYKMGIFLEGGTLIGGHM